MFVISQFKLVFRFGMITLMSAVIFIYRFMRLSSIFILFLSLSLPLFAADGVGDATAVKVSIEEIRYETSGKTLPEALEREIKLNVGSEYPSYEKFQIHLDREIQDLINLRVFSDVRAEVTVLSEGFGADGGRWETVLVVFRVEDTWTLFPFVMPSSDGSAMVLTMAVVDKNFLGTLTEFRVSGDFGVGTDPVSGSVEIPWWGVYLEWGGFSIDQWRFSTRVSQRFKTERKFDGTRLMQDYSYHETQIFIDIRYEFRKVPHLFFNITPGMGWRYAYDIRLEIDEVEYEFGRFGLSLGLDYNRVDWKNFYREGWTLGLFDAFWGTRDFEQEQFKSILFSRLSGFGIIGGVNPSARVIGIYSFNHEITGLGEFLRGVPDDGVYGDRAVFLNTGMQFRLWKGRWVEPHLLPFVDAGLAVKKDETLNWENDFFLGVGSELILFLPTIPSAQIRGWIGFDLAVKGWSRAKWEAGASFKLHY